MTSEEERGERILEGALGKAPLDPELGEEAAALAAAAARLEAAALAEREQLWKEGEDAELEAAALAHMQGLFAGEGQAEEASFSSRWVLRMAVAASVIFLVGLATHYLFFAGRDPHGVGGVVLNTGGKLTLEAPLGTVSSFELFRWTGELPPGGFWQLRVWPADADPLAKPLIEFRTEENRWKPTGDASWPRAIQWEVQGFGANREPLGSAEARASLR